ncbi:6-phosphogluconolactonase [Aquabacterium sp.]|uniref:6-phosphogluconolactonase n=1 Tax=Aquabacterium sp. TaxID=1872578 RepID=UPI0026319730|nr:6-phosphogluconolactonase [Aquabacterium sp.]MDD2977581.1 6-phosphogluconolactonase [Aquabacterium sp.]
MPELSCPPSLHHTFHHAGDPALLALDVADHVAGLLRQGVAERGRALLIVSGGSTPVPFFQALARCALDWSAVTITLADERWVPPDHPDSNEALVRAHLLRANAAAAHFVPLYNGAATPAEGVPELEATLAALPWPADAVVLGMGADGHTASLFPDAPELPYALLDAARARCLAVAAPTPPNVPVPRVSLTRRALLDTRQLIVHLTGEDKLELLHQAMLPGDVAEYPIRAVLQQHAVPCHIFHA